MAVIINDLEVVATPGGEAAAGGETEQETNQAPSAPLALSPSDLTLILEQQNERLARVRAH